MAKSVPARIVEGQLNVPLKEVAGAINVGFVLGTKVVVGTVNAGREYSRLQCKIWLWQSLNSLAGYLGS